MADYAGFTDALAKLTEEGISKDQKDMSFVEVFFMGNDIKVQLDLRAKALASFCELLVLDGSSAIVLTNGISSSSVRYDKDSAEFGFIYQWCKEHCIPYLNKTDKPYMEVGKSHKRFMFMMEPVKDSEAKASDTLTLREMINRAEDFKDSLDLCVCDCFTCEKCWFLGETHVVEEGPRYKQGCPKVTPRFANPGAIGCFIELMKRLEKEESNAN
ncbi:hypothetical protein DRO66_05140 [Candidatus Bathyarchaeota archaeon]|nr:MAG: hypothetical protein DRO66_05140 [Candidatus Bathyarchaeota archaeon]